MTLAFHHALFRGAFMVALARTEAAGVPLDHATLTAIRAAREALRHIALRDANAEWGFWEPAQRGGRLDLQAGAGRGMDRPPRVGVAETHADRAPVSRQGSPGRGRARAARGGAVRGGPPSHERAPARVSPGGRRWPESGLALPVRHDHGPECAVEQPVHLRPAPVAPASDSSAAGPRPRLHGLVGPGVRGDGGPVPGRRACSTTTRAAIPTSGSPCGSGWRRPGRRRPRIPEVRDRFKLVTLATSYGMGARSLRAKLQVPLGEAQRLLDLHHSSTRRSGGGAIAWSISRLPPPPAVHAVRVAALGALRDGAVRTHPPELARAEPRRPR